MWMTTKQVAAEYDVPRKTIQSWIEDGVKTPDGRTKLQAAKIGGRWKTRREWLDAFITACNGGELPPIGNPASEARGRMREKEECRKALAR